MQFEKRNFRVAPIVLTCYFPAVIEQFGNWLRTLNPPKKNQEKYANLVFAADTTMFSKPIFICLVYYTTVCPRSSDPFYMVTYYMKWVSTTWTDGIDGQDSVYVQYSSLEVGFSKKAIYQLIIVM